MVHRYAIKCLENNKHNHVTTTYYMIKEKQLRSEELGRIEPVALFSIIFSIGFYRILLILY